jgi:peptidoglycan/LPS O-acetylase OafA/YrhL
VAMTTDPMATRPNSTERTVFSALNGMRGLAAIAVAIFHAHSLLGLQIAPSGYLAVDLFFVLSGVVIAHAYGTRLESGLQVVDFIKIRLIRFMPFYIIGLAFGFILAFALLTTGSPYALPVDRLALAVFFGLFFLPFPFGGYIFPLNIPAWSLLYELVVNALYALLLRWLTPIVLASIIVASAIVLVLEIIIYGDANSGPSRGDIPIAMARTVFSFSIGVLLYSWRRPIKVPPALVVFLVASLFFIQVSSELRPVFDIVCIIVILPASVYIVMCSEVSSRLQSQIFDFLGDMSYGLYAVHYPLIWILRGVSDRLEFDDFSAGFGLILLLVIACGVIERRIDRPLRSYITSRFITAASVKS